MVSPWCRTYPSIEKQELRWQSQHVSSKRTKHCSLSDVHCSATDDLRIHCSSGNSHLACLWIWCSRPSILIEISLWSLLRWVIRCLSILTAVMSMSFRGNPCSISSDKSHTSLEKCKTEGLMVINYLLTSLSTKFPDNPGPPGAVSLADLSWISFSMASLVFINSFISSFKDAIDSESIPMTILKWTSLVCLFVASTASLCL